MATRTTTSFEYDAVGRVTKTTFPAASGQPAPFTKTTYNQSGQVTQTEDERGNPTYYEYQPGTGRRTAVVNAKSERTEYTLGASGETLAVEDAKHNVTRSVYDANGRLVMTQPPQITGEDPTSIQTFYDAAGRRFATVDQDSKFTIFFYDELGRLTQTTQVFGSPMTGDPEPRFLGTQFEYDEVGNRTVQRDALGRETRFEYDKLGRMTKKTYPPDANDHQDTETFTYDANGNRLTKTVGGVTTTYTYDAMNRVVTETPSAGGEAIHYSYAAPGGRLDKKEIKRGSDVVRGIAFTYDERGRIKTQSTPEGAGAFADTLTFGYDKAGNRVSVQAPAPYGTVTTDYDELNRPVDIHVPGVTGTVHVEYDANGNRGSIEYPNDIKTTYEYNEQNRLRLIKHDVDSTTIASYTYTLGPAGNRRALDEFSGRHIDWEYDDLYRLTGESITDATNGDREQVFTYDDVGNRTSLTDSTASGPTAYEYDDADHLLELTPDGSSSTAYAWDTAGRNTLIGATPYVWNPWDRLTKKDDGSATTFGYSPDGIVRTKEWKTTSPSTTQKRRYVYDRTLPYAQLLQEWDNVGNTVMADYLYLDGDLIGFKDERTGSVARYWILKDGQGSVRKVVDTAGAVVASYDYDAWGNILGQDQPSGWIFNHRAFGEIQDPNLGFTYLRARWMDPSTGRFESKDPFAGGGFDPQSLHRYTYAHLNPSTRMDPSGEFTLVELLVVLAVIAILVSIAAPALAGDDVDSPKMKAKRAARDQKLRGIVKYAQAAVMTPNVKYASNYYAEFSYKCNVLVGDSYTKGGGYKKYPSYSPGNYFQAADMFAYRADKVSNFFDLVPKEAAEPGCAVFWDVPPGSSSGHSAIYLGGDVLIFAGGFRTYTSGERTFEGVPEWSTIDEINENHPSGPRFLCPKLESR